MARRADRLSSDSSARPKRETSARACAECGVTLSAYNPNPTCWQHTLGHPWQGPNAKPKYERG